MELVRSPDLPEAAGFATAERRYSVALRGELTMARRGRPVVVRIVNISAGGLMAAVMGDAEVSGVVEIVVRHLDTLSGTVVWAREGKIGVKFDEPIDPIALMSERAERELVASRITNQLARKNSDLFAASDEDEEELPFVALMRARAGRSGLDSAH